MQQRLALPRSASHVARLAVALHLADVAADGFPALDLAGVLVGDAPPCSTGSTTETSRAGRRHKSNPSGATPIAAGWRRRRRNSAIGHDASRPAWPARTNWPEIPWRSRSCTCRRTRRGGAFRRELIEDEI